MPVGLCTMAMVFFIIGQLTPNSAKCFDVFPFHNVSPFLLFIFIVTLPI